MSARPVVRLIVKLVLAFVLAFVFYVAVLFLALFTGDTECDPPDCTWLGDLWSGDAPYFFFAACFVLAAGLVWTIAAARRRRTANLPRVTPHRENHPR